MTTLVHCGTLLATPGKEPLSKHTVAIDNGKVVSVTAGFTAAKSGETLIDLSDHFVLPGLIDCHVHLTGEFGPRHKMDIVEEGPEAIALHAARHARVELRAIGAISRPSRLLFGAAAAANVAIAGFWLAVEGPHAVSMVTAGMLNKQIAGELDLSEITVKIHRRRVMDGMQAGSLAELVKMCERVSFPSRTAKA